jgi:hypothetical protein
MDHQGPNGLGLLILNISYESETITNGTVFRVAAHARALALHIALLWAGASAHLLLV